MCKLFFFLSMFGLCRMAATNATPEKRESQPEYKTSVAAASPTAPASACTYTKDANNNVILGAGCRVEDIFINAAAGDFHLVPGAPAIGNALCLPEVTTDFDGNPRPTPGRPPGQGCDIGAFQFPNVAAPAAPTNLRIIKP
jgi:hypothetical protein